MLPLPAWSRKRIRSCSRGSRRFSPSGPGWERDPDVLDTWFSSGLWPFATLGWPDQTDELRAFYPTDVLSTARDILFLWVARMVFFGLEFAGDIPFDDVYVHSVIQAPDGRRMSKSLGTGIDPLMLIQERVLTGSSFGGSRQRVDLPMFVDLFMEGKWKLRELISRHVELEDLNKAYEMLEAGEVRRSVVLYG